MNPDDSNPELGAVDVGAIAVGFHGVSGMGGCLPGCLFLAFPPVIGGVLLGLLGFRSVPWSTPEGMFKFFALCEGIAYGELVVVAIGNGRRRRSLP